MHFQSILNKMGQADILSVPKYIAPYFINEEKVLAFFNKIINENKRVLVYGDYDPDGAYCVRILDKTFKSLGYTNYDLFEYHRRTHDIDSKAVNAAITGGYDYIIICDAGSASPEIIRRIIDYGVGVILLDHHKSKYSYEDFGDCAMINVSMDNDLNGTDIRLSAGALTFIICEKLSQSLRKDSVPSNAALALCSLYADVIDMSTELNRAIYHRAMNLRPHELPEIVQRFMSPNVKFSRRFIEFQLNPRLNTLFRGERFVLLNSLLNWVPGSDTADMADIVSTVIKHHADDSQQTFLAAQTMVCREYNDFVVGNLSSVVNNPEITFKPERWKHYTGKVANVLMEKYRKPSIVLADGGGVIKGSFRDIYGRNFLELFQTFCKANGHSAAFGIHIPYLEFEEFISYIEMLDNNPKYTLSSVGNEPIILDYLDTPDVAEFKLVGKYNEFSGIGVPHVYIRTVWRSNKAPYSKKFTNNYSWGPFTLKSKRTLRAGQELLIKPYQGNSTRNGSVQLMVEEVIEK